MKRHREMRFLLPEWCPSADLKRIKTQAWRRNHPIKTQVAAIKERLTGTVTTVLVDGRRQAVPLPYDMTPFLLFVLDSYILDPLARLLRRTREVVSDAWRSLKGL